MGQDGAVVGGDGGVVVVDQADDLGAGVGAADAQVEHAARGYDAVIGARSGLEPAET